MVKYSNSQLETLVTFLKKSIKETLIYWIHEYYFKSMIANKKFLDVIVFKYIFQSANSRKCVS